MVYDLIRSDRKSISIKIKDGRVTVRAPKGVSKDNIEELLDKHREKIEAMIQNEMARRIAEPVLTEREISALKRSARLYFSATCERYAKIMNLEYNRISITSAKTRFGSCSSKKNISFSYRLMFYPELAREYVVVHELAHLVYMNHSKNFYGVIEKYMPDYKERKKLLKDSQLKKDSF